MATDSARLGGLFAVKSADAHLTLAAGLVIYVLYGRRHSRLQQGETVITEES